MVEIRWVGAWASEVGYLKIVDPCFHDVIRLCVYCDEPQADLVRWFDERWDVDRDLVPFESGMDVLADW